MDLTTIDLAPDDDGASRIRLLIVEDDPADVLRLRYALQAVERIDFHICHASRVEDGLRRIESEAIDAVLLDLTLPGESVAGVLAAARSAFARVPVIVLAPEDQQEAGLEAVRLGAQGYLVKDHYGIRDLVQAFRQAVARHAKVSELHMASERDHFRATHDVLTGLYNRSALEGFMLHCLAQAERMRNQVALLFLDLDRFKPINDAFGHEVGDQLLRMVAERLNVVTRRSNMAARLGGDEFVMLLQDFVEDHVPARVAQIVIDALAMPFVIDGIEHQIGASVGIAVYPRDAGDPSDLIRRADTAMYHAKAKGRNGYHFYAEGMDDMAARQLQLEAALRNARSKGELRLHYQPIVDLAENRVVGVGALLRWQRDSGLLNAADFLPLAERIGVLDDLGAWILQKACETAATLDLPEDGEFRMVIKVSRGQLDDRRFIDTVTRTLRTTGIGPHRLGIEVRQGCTLQASKTATATLRGLRELGVKVTIEGFASNCTSLTDFKHQPMDAVKIDRSLVQAATQDHYERNVVALVSQLAQSLGIEAVATGVETAEQRDLLIGLNCYKMQGNIFAEAVNAAELPEALARLRATGTRLVIA